LKNYKLLTLSEQIAMQIRQDIYSEVYKKGEFLRETQLAKQFNISRGPVRQALATLANEGLLDLQPNIGAQISDHPSKEAFGLILKLRKDIETFVLNQILELIDEEDIRYIEELLADIKEACAAEDVNQLMLCDYAFHEFLIEKYDDKHILSIWNAIMPRMMMQYTRFVDLMSSYEEHLLIVEEIKKKHKHKTVKALQDNIQ
jgi:GntR family transcriptional regulator, gluconate operon transcriptional repressor